MVFKATFTEESGWRNSDNSAPQVFTAGASTWRGCSLELLSTSGFLVTNTEVGGGRSPHSLLGLNSLMIITLLGF